MENKNKLIALLFVGVLMGALDISIVGPAIPSIEKALQIGDRYSGWIFSIYVLFNLIGISLFARLSDIFGRRTIYILALSVFAIGSVIVSFTTNFEWLLTGRAVQGFGASGIFPVASALVGDLFPVEKRGRILGMIGAVFGLAFLIGPFIAGVLLHYFSWNFLFIINLPIAAVLIYYSFRILPEKSSVNVSKIDWKGIVSLGIGLAAFTYGINNIDGNNLNSIVQPLVILPFIVAIIAIFILWLNEKKADAPIINLGFLKNNQIVLAGILAVVTGLIQACFVFIPKYVVGNFSVEPSTASFMLTPFVLATAIGSPVFGRLIDKFGVKIIIIIGLLLLAVGFYLLSITATVLFLYYLSGSLIGLGLSVLSGSSLRYIMLNNTGVDDRATSQGMLTIFTSVGQLSGSAIVGILLALSVNGFQLIFTGISILLFTMVFLAFKLKNR